MKAERYRRLPGHRRGIVNGASVWLGSDHLLAVRSTRFRESYKRFYFRDVQAIAVARKPRFHISSRPLVLGIVMLWTYLILRSLWDWADVVFWSVLLLLTAVWVVVSAAFSCTCRIYTAVSKDELPSVYRTWTARRFLAKVEPLLAKAQGGILEGDWTAVAEPKGVGPAPVREFQPDEPAPVHVAPTAFERAPARLVPNTAAFFFIAVLLADGGFSFATMQLDSPAVNWGMWGLALARIATAIVIVVQHHFKRERDGMRRLAIVSLVVMGLVFYIQQVMIQISSKAGEALSAGIAERVPWLVQIDTGLSFVLALAALVVVLRSDS